MKKETIKKTFERTISEPLFETIKMLRRYEDVQKLVYKTGLSRPVIDKALNYGHIRQVSLETAIIEFYEIRAKEQDDAVLRIINILNFLHYESNKIRNRSYGINGSLYTSWRRGKIIDKNRGTKTRTKTQCTIEREKVTKCRNASILWVKKKTLRGNH